MKKKIIFLDIDGVLNSKAYFDSIKESEILATEKIHIEISEYHVKLLSELCHACDANFVNKISDGGLQQKHVSEAIHILNERK